MALETFANNALTTVSSGGTTAPDAGTSETWTVASSSTFPGADSSAAVPTQFHVKDNSSSASSEIILVTNVDGTTWTVTRGAEGTTPVAHTSGFTIQQVVTAGVLDSLSQAVNVRAYGAVGDGSTDDTTAFSDAWTALTAQDGGGALFVPAGKYKTSSTVGGTLPEYVASYVIVCQPGVTFEYYGTSGPCIQMHGPANGNDTPPNYAVGSGIIGNPIIDGTNASAGCSGLEFGDINQGIVNVTVQNFSGTGSIGAHLINNTFWCEQTQFRIHVNYCTSGVVFDVGTSGFGSFDRCDIWTGFEQDATYNGVTWQNGANIAGGSLTIVGNWANSATALTSYVLGLLTDGGLYGTALHINVETDGSAGTDYPYSIYSDGTGAVGQCQGIAMFSNFQASNLTSGEWYDNVVQSEGGGGPLGNITFYNVITAEGGSVSNPTLITTDTWHDFVLDSGWTVQSSHATPAYRLLPDGSMALKGAATHASFTSATALNSENELPTAYRPANYQYKAGDSNTAGCEYNPSGEIIAEPMSGGSTTLSLDGVIFWPGQ